MNLKYKYSDRFEVYNGRQLRYIGKSHSRYSYEARNFGRDLIYQTRTRLLSELRINYMKTPEMFKYCAMSFMGVILH